MVDGSFAQREFFAMSSKPLVPSKDALRTLRLLATSPPAALIGATGAVCGVLAIHYHERQRVRKAEAILETKRKLHSISGGRGSARLALMFEAAERGEDFTIQRERSRTKSGRRSYSALPAQHDTENATEWKPFTHSNERQPSQLTSAQLANVQSGRRVVGTSGSDNYSDSPEFEPFKHGREVPNQDTPIIKRIWIDANSSRQRTGMKVWPESRNKTKRRIRRVSSDLAGTERTSENHGLLNELSKSPFEQSVTDLSPIWTIPKNFPGDVADEEHERHSILLKTDLSNLFSNSFGSLQPWQVDSLSENLHQEDSNQPISPIHKPADVDLYLSSSAPIPSYEVEHEYRSRYNLNHVRIRKGMAVIGAGRYIYVFESLMNCRTKSGLKHCLSLLEQTLKQYIATNKRSDFALAQALFLDCVRLFPNSELRPMVWRLVKQFLGDVLPRLEIVSFLYPQCGAGAQHDGQHYFFLAHQYLDYIREQGYGLDRQVVELRKVLAGTQMSNIIPHEHLMIPALRAFCNAGRMTSAQALWDEMTTVYKINTTFYSLQILVKGYSQVGNWSKVKSILDSCYSRGLAEQKTYGLSNLLVPVIRDYSLSHTPEMVIQFVMHSLKAYRLQPISSMTKEIVILCLRHRRYDLVVSWLDTIRTDYPYIETGIGSNTFAVDIAGVWRDIDASCEDVLAGCRALATRTLRDPFSTALRSSISEAVARFMSARLNALQQELDTDIPTFTIAQIDHFRAALTASKASVEIGAEGSRARLLLKDLLHQCEAVEYLNAMCRGHQDFEGIEISGTSDHESEKKTKSLDVRLPPMSELQDTLLKKYEQLGKTGRPSSHEDLRNITARLAQQGRPFEAFDLIQIIHDSRWVQPPHGREFDIGLFTNWLKLAWELKSGSRLRTVLWAIADAGPQLKLTSQIILMAKIAAPKTHLRQHKSARSYETDEVEYLILRLRRRLWSTSSPSAEMRLDSWRGFGQPLNPLFS